MLYQHVLSKLPPLLLLKAAEARNCYPHIIPISLMCSLRLGEHIPTLWQMKVLNFPSPVHPQNTSYYQPPALSGTFHCF